MKISPIIFAALTTLSVQSYSQTITSGIVVVGERGCAKRDNVVIQTNMGFSLVEQYSGSFDKGDKVIGDIESYGFKDVLVNGSASRLYVDDYMASKNKAIRWCYNK